MVRVPTHIAPARPATIEFQPTKLLQCASLMTLTIQLPDELARRLREKIPDLESEARESFAVDLYRRRELTHHQLSQVLGLDRFQTDGVLKKHGVMLDLTAEEFAAELADARELVRK